MHSSNQICKPSTENDVLKNKNKNLAEIMKMSNKKDAQ
jgi:hypothetical protein